MCDNDCHLAYSYKKGSALVVGRGVVLVGLGS